MIFDASKYSPAFERALEFEIIDLSKQVEVIRRFSLGRNIHPMRPDLWMCTHIWEMEFDNLNQYLRFRSKPSIDAFIRKYFVDHSHKIRSASIAYTVLEGDSGGNLLLPGRIRRLHLANFVATASDEMKSEGDKVLLSMPLMIPQIRGWALGYRIDADEAVLPSFEHSWDTSFDNIADLQVYVTCKYHHTEAHDFAVTGDQRRIYRDLQSCLYEVNSEMSGGHRG